VKTLLDEEFFGRFLDPVLVFLFFSIALGLSFGIRL